MIDRGYSISIPIEPRQQAHETRAGSRFSQSRQSCPSALQLLAKATAPQPRFRPIDSSASLSPLLLTVDAVDGEQPSGQTSSMKVAEALARAANNVAELAINVGNATLPPFPPFAPRKPVSDVLAWALCFAVFYGAAWAICGGEALPGGRVFSIVILFSCAVVFGWVAEAVKLPALFGQITAGIILRNIPYLSVVGRNIDPTWGGTLRMLAITVLMLRAGVGLDPLALRKLTRSVVALVLVPLLCEASVCAVLAHFLLQFGWAWSYMFGFVLSAASGAVIIPNMLSIQARGLGVDKAIPTIAIAAASFDNVLAILFMGISLGFAFDTGGSAAWRYGQGPLKVACGMLYGLIAGVLLWYLPHSYSKSLALFRFAMLFGLGTFSVFAFQRIGLSGAGALGGLLTGLFAGIGWRRMMAGAVRLRNRTMLEMFSASMLLAKLWLALFQPLLFSLIAVAVSFENTDWSSVWRGAIVIGVGVMFRCSAAVVALTGSGLLWKEKLFIGITWMSKATVQAALGPLAYDTARQLGPSAAVEKERGLKILTLAVLAIVVTVPVYAFVIKAVADRLLQRKTVLEKT